MRTVRVNIERAADGTFGAYMPDDNGLTYGVIGDGSSAEAAMEDFKSVYREIKEAMLADGQPFEEDAFEFCYEVPAFLASFGHIVSSKGLAQLAGIAPAQLSHYASGFRNASPKTVAKLQSALQSLADELGRVKLA